MEAKTVLLVDVEVSKLTDVVMQRMLYMGGSHANTYLKVAFYEDVAKGDYRAIVDVLQEQIKLNDMNVNKNEENSYAADVIEAKLPGARKSIIKLLQMETNLQ